MTLKIHPDLHEDVVVEVVVDGLDNSSAGRGARKNQQVTISVSMTFIYPYETVNRDNTVF